jgi:hypothetical protein
MHEWPLHLMMVDLPGGEIIPGLLDQVRSSCAAGVIQVIDGGIVRKGEDGELSFAPASELPLADDPRTGKLARLLFGFEANPAALDWVNCLPGQENLEPQLFGLSSDDLAEIVDAIPRASDTLVLLIEHRWNSGFAESVSVGNGVLLAQGAIVPRTVRELFRNGGYGSRSEWLPGSGMNTTLEG